jgi:hypothetical protein
MGEIIAERSFRTPEGKPVVARVYQPEKIGSSSEWSCKIEVQGLESPFERSSMGVDSFQALYLALRGLCVQLDEIADNLVFLDGEAGDAATPLIMPWSFSRSLKTEVYRLIQEKIEGELNSDQRPTK